MQLQVFPFKAKELAIIDYDTDLFWEPSGSSPKPPVFIAANRSGKHQYAGYSMYGLSCG